MQGDQLTEMAELKAAGAIAISEIIYAKSGSSRKEFVRLKDSYHLIAIDNERRIGGISDDRYVSAIDRRQGILDVGEFVHRRSHLHSLTDRPAGGEFAGRAAILSVTSSLVAGS